MGTSGAMSTSNDKVKYSITIGTNWQSVSENYSSVNVKVNFWRTNSGYQTYGTGVVYCKINGTTYSASVSSSQKITNSGITLFNRDVAVGHNADGSKYLDTSAWISMDTPLSSSEQWYGEWLTTIPRASQPTLSSNNVTMGNNVTIYTNRASNSFTHCLYYQIGNGGWNTIATNIKNNYTWTIPTSLANNSPNSTNLNLNMILETYSGNTYIGSKSVNLNANVPISFIPIINSVTLTENTSGISDKFDCYVQGKSTIKGIISASGVYSSTIKNYEIKINGQSFNSSNFTTNALTGSGTCTIKVTDSRNKSASQNISYSVTNYSNPTINTFAVVRCNEDGTENDEGACAKCTLKATISSVNNKNDKTFQLLYRKLTDTSYTTINLSDEDYCHESTQIIEADINNEYEFIFRVSDYFSTAEKSLNLGTAFTLVDYNASGRSIAFGRVSTALENEKKIQIKLNTEIEGDFKLNSKTIFDLIYPVGSIYMSVNSTNPTNLFGGTWVTWGQGRVPVGVSTSGTFNSVEKTGGSETHTLTIAQMPSHTHTQNSHRHNYGRPALFGGENNDDGSIFTPRYTGRTSSQYKGNSNGWTEMSYTTATNQNTGGGGSHNNLQPYITCYMWKRTA